MKGLKVGGKLKTTGNHKVEVKAVTKAAKVPGLPGMKGLTEASGVKKGGSC